VPRSSTEAEYKALANATSDPVWFEALVRELGISLNHVFGVRILTPHACISANQFSMPTIHIQTTIILFERVLQASCWPSVHIK
jgi:hypothetical protein